MDYFRQRVQRFAVKDLATQAEVDLFVQMQPLDAQDADIWASLKLRTRVLCPMPSQTTAYSLLSLAVPLVDVMQIDFAVVKDASLLQKHATPSMVPGDCQLYTDAGRLEGLTREQTMQLSSPSGLVDIVLGQLRVQLSAAELFAVSSLLGWTTKAPLLYF